MSAHFKSARTINKTNIISGTNAQTRIKNYNIQNCTQLYEKRQKRIITSRHFNFKHLLPAYHIGCKDCYHIHIQLFSAGCE